MSRSIELWTLKCGMIVRETEAAMLVDYDGDQQWIPISQVTEIQHNLDGSVDITMTAWIAKQKDFI